jgi:hypothetical protein
MTIEFKLQTGEIFLPIKDHKGYKVSNHGRVYSTKKGRTMVGRIDDKGYVYYTIQGKDYSGHRLVAEVFIENPFNHPLVNHIDGTKFNNHLDNLEWLDHKDNNRHAVLIGLNNRRIINEEKAEAIRGAYKDDNITYGMLAKEYGVGKATISKVILNKICIDPNYTPPDFGYVSPLTKEFVKEIRDKFGSRESTVYELAKEYGVGRNAITKIIENTTWYDPEYVKPPRKSAEVTSLDIHTVNQIRSEYRTGKYKQSELGDKYGLGQGSISRLLTNKAWYDPEYDPNERIVKTFNQKYYTPVEKKEVSETTIKEIRDKYTSGLYTKVILAKEYGLGQTHLSDIVNNNVCVDTSYIPPLYGYRGNKSLNEVIVKEIRDKFSTGEYSRGKLRKCYNIGSKDTLERVLLNVSWYDPEYTPDPLIIAKRMPGRVASSKVIVDKKNTPVKNCSVKLSFEEAKEIRDKYATGDYSIPQLLKIYNVKDSKTISKIIHNRSWHDPEYTFVLHPNKIEKQKQKAHYRELILRTNDEIKEIRDKYAAGGYAQRTLAEEYKMGVTTMVKILKNKSYYDPEYVPADRTAPRFMGIKP